MPFEASTPGPLLVYFHGGGWVLCDLDTHDQTCRFIAREAGVRVLAVDYRLAPEHPFPAALDDAVAAVRFAIEEAGRLGADPARVAVGGDSAGANLAAAAARLLSKDDGKAPAFQLLLYPVTDLSHKRRSYQLFQGRVLPHRAPDGLVSRPLPPHGGRGVRPAGIPAPGGRSRRPPAGTRRGVGVRRVARRGRGVRERVCGKPACRSRSTATRVSCTASATRSTWGERPARRCSR